MKSEAFNIYRPSGLFLNGDLLDATLMTATFEGGGEELVEDLLGGLVIDETAWQNEAVGVVMLADELSDVLAPGKAGAYTLMLVQGHDHSLTAAADGDTGIDLTALDGFCQRMGEIGIVNTLVTICTEVLVRIALLLEILKDELLEGESCVIAGDTYCLYFHKLAF